MPLTRISTNFAFNAAAANSISSAAIPVVAGDLLVAFAASAGLAINKVFSDTQANGYTAQPALDMPTSLRGARSAYVLAVAASGNVTVTCAFSALVNQRSLVVIIYRGNAAFRDDAQQLQGPVSGVDSITSGALAGIAATDLIVGYGHVSPGNSIAAGTGFNDLGQAETQDRSEDTFGLTEATFTPDSGTSDSVAFALAFIDNTPSPPTGGSIAAISGGRRHHRR